MKITPHDFNQICAYSDKRDEKAYAWLRYLILLASGALTVLVSLNGNKEYTGIPVLCMKMAWVSLGSGILFGSMALFGEIWTARELVRLLVKQKKENNNDQNDSLFSPIIATRPFLLKICEPLCYVSLVTSILSIIVFALMK